MDKRPLTHVDLAWLRMDNPKNLMIITGFMTFDRPLDLASLKAVTAGSLLKFERFRQRVVLPDRPLERPYWEEDPAFDIDRHIEVVRLPGRAGKAELEAMIGLLMSTPLPYDRPLWKLYLVKNYEQGSALVGRLHHAIADGIALMHVLLSMASEDPNAPLPAPYTAPSTQARSKADAAPPAGYDRPLPKMLDQMTELAAGLAGRISDEAFKMLLSPDYARNQMRLGAGAALALGRLALRLPDPATVFKGDPSREKRATWSAPLPLDEVKTTGRALDGTINDILLTAVAGALRRYMRMHGFSTRDLNIRSIIPVNLRPIERAGELGNEFGMVFLSLPLGIQDPVARLRELKRRMDKLKSTPEAAVAFGVLGMLGAAPEKLQEVGVGIFDTKGSAVMTNVPGPKKPLYLAGRAIETVMAWVPSSGRVSLGVSILSYNGKVWLGVTTDRSLVDDPERIVQFFKEEFNEMLHLARKVPIPQPNPIQAMNAALDRAMKSVDELLSQRAASPAAAPVRQPPQPAAAAPGAAQAAIAHCLAHTRQGKPCRNQPLHGSTFCRVHRPSKSD